MACEKFALAFGLCFLVGCLQIGLGDALKCISCTMSGNNQDECLGNQTIEQADIKNYEVNTSDTFCLLYITHNGTVYNREPSSKYADCTAVDEGEEISACYQCSGDDCNTDKSTAHPTSNTCYECEGGPDSDCAQNPTEITDSCTLNDDRYSCYAYTYINKESSIINTTRGCTETKTACVFNETEIHPMTSCSTCQSDKCNGNFESNNNTHNYCVSCDKDCVYDGLKNVDYKIAKTCTVYQYKNGNETVTIRGTGEDGGCQALKNETDLMIMCNECTARYDKLCNSPLSTTDGRPICVTDGNGTCQTDDTVSPYCLIYEYINLNDKGKKATFKGCGNNKCTNMVSDHATICTACQEDKCNAEIDPTNNVTKRYCLDFSCAGNEDECSKKMKLGPDSKIQPLNDGQVCVVYQLNDGNKTINATHGDSDECKTISEKLDLLKCNQCTSDEEVCNTDVDTIDKRPTCISCDDNDCQTATKTCTTDDTVHVSCYTRKYIALDGNEYVNKTEKGCIQKSENEADCYKNFETAKNGKSILCQPCSPVDGGNCNEATDETNVKQVCLKCEGNTNSACANGTLELDNTATCDSEGTDCVTYSTINVAGDKTIHRGCLTTETTCDTLPNAGNEITLQCDSCSLDGENPELCNKERYNGENEKTVCASCTNCTADEEVEMCRLEDSDSACYVYSYDDKDSETRVVRGCDKKSFCDDIKKNPSNRYEGTLKKCGICVKDENDSLCNRNLEGDAIGGASSITGFSTILMSLFTCVAMVRIVY